MVALVLNGIVGGLVVVGIVRDREPSPAATVAVLVVGSLLYLLAIVLTMLLVFVAIRTTADGILGRTGAAADAWRTAVRCVPRALSIFALGIGGGIAVGAVTALLVYLGANEHWGAFVLVLLLSLLLLAVAAVICWLKFSYTLPAMLLEGHEPVGDGQALNTRPIGLFAAAGRSWRLTSGRAWRTLGIVLLMSMIVGAATSLVSPIVQIPTSVLSATDSSVVVTTIVSAVSMGFAALMSCLSPIVSGATLTVLYADARIRDEGLGQGVHGYATQGIPANPWIGGGVSARPGEAPWSQIGIVPEVRGGQDGQYR